MGIWAGCDGVGLTGIGMLPFGMARNDVLVRLHFWGWKAYGVQRSKDYESTHACSV